MAAGVSERIRPRMKRYVKHTTNRKNEFCADVERGYLQSSPSRHDSHLPKLRAERYLLPNTDERPPLMTLMLFSTGE